MTALSATAEMKNKEKCNNTKHDALNNEGLAGIYKRFHVYETVVPEPR